MPAARENVTISLPTQMVRAARHLAVDHGMSLSAFVGMVLEERMAASRLYEEAKDTQLRLMRDGLDLGTGGQVSWTRDELYER